MTKRMTPERMTHLKDMVDTSYSGYVSRERLTEALNEIDALRAEAEELQSALETLVKLYGAEIMARNTL